MSSCERLVAILQDEIEQRQQNGDEKSLNNGTIFVKCYLVSIILLRSFLLPVEWGRNRLRWIAVVSLASALSALTPDFWLWYLLQYLYVRCGISLPEASFFWQKALLFIAFGCLLVILNHIWTRNRPH